MANISKKNIIATMLVYGIARGVVDELKPSEGDEAIASDTTVFEETMKALGNKEAEVSNGK